MKVPRSSPRLDCTNHPYDHLANILEPMANFTHHGAESRNYPKMTTILRTIMTKRRKKRMTRRMKTTMNFTAMTTNLRMRRPVQLVQTSSHLGIV
jgi:hypothetical protein